MTKNEFIQRAAISMCANPKFTIEAQKPYNPCSLYCSSILKEARRLADQMENEISDFQTDELDTKESMLTHVGNIASELLHIREAIGDPKNADERSTFHEIVYQLNSIRSALAGGLSVALVNEYE